MNEKHRLQLNVEELGTRNVAMARCLKLAAFAAKSEVPVLILGETGTGKTLLAQAKILRAVECGEFERLGSERSLHSNARIFSATNRSLRGLINEGRFREDLYHRLNGLTLHIPPLRDRRQDLPAMIAGEIKLAAAECGKTVTAIDPAAMQKLLAHPWPGNLREIHHAIHTMLLLADGEIIAPEHIQFEADLMAVSPLPERNGKEQKPRLEPDSNDDLTLAGAVRAHIHRVCETVNGNQRNVAACLGISRATLRRHLQRVDSQMH